MFVHACRILILSFVAFALAACSSLPSVGGGGRESFAAGASSSYRLTGADRAVLESAFTRAMESDETQSWRGARAAGAVTPGQYSLANLMAHPDARIALVRPDIDLHQVLETEMGLYALTRNSNVRIGPGTDYNIADTLPSGTGVDVAGRVKDKPWMMVAVGGIIRGYVHQNLMIKAPGSELELAGGPFRRPLLCRDFSQTLTAGGARERWTGAACNDGAGWRLARPEPAPAEEGEGLLEF